MYQPEKLKARRKELKMTQKDIADQLEISYQAYSAWERGVKEPSKEQVISVSENLYEYHVYEKMSAGIGASVYDDREYDIVYFDEELAHDFASWVSGDSMEPKYRNGSVALIRETGFDYDGAVYAVVWNFQTFIKKVYREKEGLRLVSINKDYKDIYIPYDENPRIVGKIVGDFMPLEV